MRSQQITKLYFLLVQNQFFEEATVGATLRAARLADDECMKRTGGHKVPALQLHCQLQRSPESFRRGSGQPAERRCEVTLAREPGAQRNLRDW